MYFYFIFSINSFFFLISTYLLQSKQKTFSKSHEFTEEISILLKSFIVYIEYYRKNNKRSVTFAENILNTRCNCNRTNSIL